MSFYNPACSLIDIDGALNLRDLGGMPIRGGVFPYGVFVRSGSLSEVSAETLAKIKEYGVRNVIDLRSDAEIRKYGNPAIDDRDISFYAVSLFLGDPDSDKDPTMNYLKDHLLGHFYIKIVEEIGHNVAEALRILAVADGTALFHCAHGKDRTGIIAALLYLLAGASYEDIIRNYSFSYEYISWFLDPLIAVRENNLKHTLRSDRVNMEIFLNHIDKVYGGDVMNYFDKIGLEEEYIAKLKKKIGI
ncbi:MAG: tyrosine-protein phosphatase [Clostridiales bacterium]|nr:tyrosine-protein phosphatase [Clostridiales bacterium]